MTLMTERGSLNGEPETPPRGPVPSDITASTRVATRTDAVRAALEVRRSQEDERWEALREDVEFLCETGETREGIERRTGCTWGTITKRFKARGVPMPLPRGDVFYLDELTRMGRLG